MLRRLLEAGSQLLFDDAQQDSFKKYQALRSRTLKDPAEALTMHDAEGELLQQIRDAKQHQEAFTQEAYTLISDLLHKYTLEDLPEERLAELAALLLPNQQPAAEKVIETTGEAQLLPKLTDKQEKIAKIIFRLDSDQETASMRNMVELVYQKELDLLNDPEKRRAKIQQYMNTVATSKDRVFAKIDLVFDHLDVDIMQPLSLNIDQLNKIPEDSGMKSTILGIISTKGYEGMSWDQIKQLTTQAKPISRVNAQLNLDNLKPDTTYSS